VKKATFPRAVAVQREPARDEPDRIQALAERWSEKHAAAVQTVRQELRKAAPGAGPDELLLRDLAGSSAVTSDLLLKLELGLAQKALDLAADPKLCSAIARTLCDVARVNNAIGRRVRESLHAAAVLKAQRLIGSGGRDGV
jgi:hypothetical protein